MKYYLILDKTNLVLKSFKDKEEAEAYVKARPYLKVSEFDDSPRAPESPNAQTPVADDLSF